MANKTQISLHQKLTQQSLKLRNHLMSSQETSSRLRLFRRQPSTMEGYTGFRWSREDNLRQRSCKQDSMATSLQLGQIGRRQPHSVKRRVRVFPFKSTWVVDKSSPRVHEIIFLMMGGVSIVSDSNWSMHKNHYKPIFNQLYIANPMIDNHV